ncbi:ATP-binding protein [Streptomyces sp. NPDC007861]|uniref:ATP-binding protein n=1 Tax=Streptomyces sp. NPDC007861 TaxID=3154893 RepID=UPI00340E13D4
MTAHQRQRSSAEGPAAPLQDDDGLAHLLSRLSLLQRRVFRAVAARMDSNSYETPDPLRGLYVSDEAVAWLCRNPVLPLPPDPQERDLLGACEKEADAAEARGMRLPLRELSVRFGLSALDVEVLLIALAPELDPRYERFYGYLHDDVNRRHATVALALRLCGLPAHDGGARVRLQHGPLVGTGLVRLEQPDQPLLVRALRVSDRVVSYLLGHSAPLSADPAMSLVREVPLLPASARLLVRQVCAALGQGQLVYLRGRLDSAVESVADAAVQEGSGEAVRVDPRRLSPGAEAGQVLQASVLEARLRGCGLHVGPVPGPEGGAEDAWVLRPLEDAGVPVVVTGQTAWDPARCGAMPVVLACPAMSARDRSALWRGELEGGLEGGLDAAEVGRAVVAMGAHRIGAADVRVSVRAAHAQARAAGGRLDVPVLQASARLRHGSGLERLARRIEPAARLGDLVLPELPRGQLDALVVRARHREEVLQGWGMLPGSSRGAGTTALFTGDSGTGKTLAAEAVAAELGLDLYIINLATLIDKYIGETEKNLERVFAHAEGVSAVLLFDEADAVFGKRSETASAHDRYANIETAYLLQRLESFDGIAVLTTNLSANIDTAFTRRLDLIVRFPAPDEHHRRLLWDHCLGTAVRRSPGLDLDLLARTFTLSGGSIRNCAITAAYHSAATGQPFSTESLLEAVRAEYLKLGRLVSEPFPYSV